MNRYLHVMLVAIASLTIAWGEAANLVAWQLTPGPKSPAQTVSPPAGNVQKDLSVQDPAKEQDAAPKQAESIIAMHGDLKCWHNVMLSLKGPWAAEDDTSPSPFVDYSMVARFRHESGTPDYFVLGYFAADGNAANSSAEEGNIWRAHLSPDKSGRWTYEVLFRSGPGVAFDFDSGKPLAPYNGLRGDFVVMPSDKKGSDLRARGRLQYVGKRYLKFAESGRSFLKVGVDSPETLLAYQDFDGTSQHNPGKNRQLKTWAPHQRDWLPTDATWKDGQGKGLIGALNYIADSGLNSVSFLTYNAGGDGDNVWPFVSRDQKLVYDCSKLDQWGIVFSHATSRGIHLHMKLQENEIDDERVGDKLTPKPVAESLDGGRLGPERMLYLQQMIARFGHHLALNWNLGEENTQTTDELKAMAAYIREIDPYRHPIVLHTFPDQQNEVYQPLVGDKNALSGVSLQNDYSSVHRLTYKWIEASRASDHAWVVANDEQNPASDGVPCDPGFEGSDGTAFKNGVSYTQADIRKYTLWGNLLAGGAGVEYYFGYRLPQNDLNCEDFRSRARLFQWSRIALEFIREQKIPYTQMTCVDELVGNDKHDNSRYAFAQSGKIYLVYLPGSTSYPARLNLTDVEGAFEVAWFNPREGGALVQGSVVSVEAGKWVELGTPPELETANPNAGVTTSKPTEDDSDWLIVVRRQG
jgi:hypothetical protein